MSYVPNSAQIYTAAFAGAMSGMSVALKTDLVPGTTLYDGCSTIAGAFAQQFDTTWASGSANVLQIDLAQDNAYSAWISRTPVFSAVESVPSTYANIVSAIIGVITSASNYFAAQGITPPSPGGAVVAGSAGYVIFRPGVASSGQAVATAAELPSAIAAGATELFVDTSSAAATIPAGFQLDLLKGAVRLLSWNAVFAPGSGDLLTVADTGSLKNPGYIGPGLKVNLTCTTAPGIVFTTGTSIATLIVDRGALSVTGTGADGILLASGNIVQIQGREQATLNGPTSSAFNLITAGSGAVAGLFGFGVGAGFNARSIGSHAGGTQIFNTDSSSTPPAFANALGSSVLIFSDLQQNLAFTSGATGARPATPRAGQPYFDTTIHGGIQWNPAAPGGGGWQGPGTVARVVTHNALATFAAAFAPGTSGNSILAAFDVTPNQSGLLEVSADFQITANAADVCALTLVYVDLLTGIVGGTPIATGITGSPTSTTPAASSGVAVSSKTDVTGVNGGVNSVSIGFSGVPIQAVPGHRTLVAVLALSASAVTQWGVTGTGSVIEQPL